jgi:hypothetical protein
VTPEAKVKQAVRKILDTWDLVYYFMPAASIYGRAGVPDIVGCINGTLFAIECKAGAGNKATALQDAAIAKIRRAKGYATIINEANLHTLEEFLVSAYHRKAL